MCSFMHACVCVCVCVLMHACVHDYVCFCVHVYVFIYACMHACTRVCVCVCVCVCVRVRVCVCRHAPMYQTWTCTLSLLISPFISTLITTRKLTQSSLYQNRQEDRHTARKEGWKAGSSKQLKGYLVAGGAPEQQREQVINTFCHTSFISM